MVSEIVNSNDDHIGKCIPYQFNSCRVLVINCHTLPEHVFGRRQKAFIERQKLSSAVFFLLRIASSWYPWVVFGHNNHGRVSVGHYPSAVLSPREVLQHLRGFLHYFLGRIDTEVHNARDEVPQAVSIG